MADDEKALINIDTSGLTKPGKALIKAIEKGIGKVYEPTHRRRMAKADVAAERARAQGRLEMTELQERAFARVIHQESRNQNNIDGIVEKALPLLEHDAKPDEIDEDWTAYFFESNKTVSDQEMQSLWGKILAGEANRQSLVCFPPLADYRIAPTPRRLCANSVRLPIVDFA